jgi:ankyrin repeat protein
MGVDTKAKDDKGYTALQWAAQNRNNWGAVKNDDDALIYLQSLTGKK